jgi:hypothetical protein
VYDSRIAFACGTTAQVIRGKWRVRRTLNCIWRDRLNVIIRRGKGPQLAPGQSLEEFCDLYQKFS